MHVSTVRYKNQASSKRDYQGPIYMTLYCYGVCRENEWHFS